MTLALRISLLLMLVLVLLTDRQTGYRGRPRCRDHQKAHEEVKILEGMPLGWS